MYGEPNWLASYRAKKMTRRAFSVYRSNMFPLEKLPLIHSLIHSFDPCGSSEHQWQFSSCSIFPEPLAPGKQLGWERI
jgi:hypothetical protein